VPVTPAGTCAQRGMPTKLIRQIYTIGDPGLAAGFVDQLAVDLQDQSCLPEVHSLGRTPRRWHAQIVVWHQARVSNGPTEAINNLIRRIKHIGCGLRQFSNYRIRALLYAGKPNWNPLPTLTPAGFRRARMERPATSLPRREIPMRHLTDPGTDTFLATTRPPEPLRP